MEMKKQPKTMTGRREFLRALGGGVASVTVAESLSGDARALPVSYQDRRKSEYRANSPEVQNFYRVNRYPAK
jgi:hypothetical protein